MPLKEMALIVASSVSATASAVGAANTLVHLPDGSWHADNTDVPGMVAALREVAGLEQASSIAILGAGGTARAALAAAAQLGAAEVTVYARRPAAIEQLEPVAAALGVAILPAGWDVAADCRTAQLVLSTVPKGVADDLAVDWRPETVLFDALYHPWPTPLAASAQAAGCRIVSGLDLLLAQALGQFEQFTGIEAPAAAMAAALHEASRNR
jgi:shikimate dehydrogenase